ncbi:MAG: hypothetical protein JWQ38_2750 [Flavipsychrobacter sp.]|nr:hypothetical protein [Flavipsychrobacter sp.]
MFQSHAKSLVVTLFVFCGVSASAQTTGASNPTNGRENNPYSKFGIGTLINGNNTVLRGMGNITSAFANPYEVNTDNPASYSFLQRTTFEAGGTGSSNTLKTTGEDYKTGTATVAYMNIGIPLSKTSGMCFGFRPHSRSYYNLYDSVVGGSPIGNYSKIYRGEGNLNYAYLGAAKQYKGLSVGFNVGYMFGTMENFTAIVPDSAGSYQAYTSSVNNYNRLGGIYWKGGIMYEHKLDSNYTIRIGGTFTMKQNIKERLNSYQVSIFDFHDSLVNDTSHYVGEQKGNMTLPMSFSVGVMLAKGTKWNVGIDFSGTKWSDFNSAPDNSLNMNVGDAAYKTAIGGEYTPDANNIRNYFSRVTYRFGAYYGTDYVKINNTTLPYYGLTAGASLPFRRSLSKVHMAFDIGRLGMTTNNLIQQTYVRFTLGFSLNDKWFIPKKYD